MRLLRVNSINICCVIIVCSLLLPAQVIYGDGSGTAEDPYLIYDANQMNAIGAEPNDWDKHFKLMADIDLSGFTGTQFNIIGNQSNHFTGVFDGNNCAIANFTYDSWDESQIGLFGVTEGEIRNVTLSNFYVHDFWANQVAGLAAQNIGTIENCQVQGDIVGWRNTGGIVGYNLGNVIDCSADCYIRCRFSTGGLVGQNGGGGVVLACYAGGDIGGHYDIGGLVGTNNGQVRCCFASAGVIGETDMGGLVGHNSGEIDCCYSTGEVSGDSGVGGLVGYNSWFGKIFYSYSTGHVSSAGLHGGLVADGEGIVISSYWDIETCGVETSIGGVGKPTEDMKNVETYIGWGCDAYWQMNDGNDYPRLTWENSPGEPIVYRAYLTGSGTESAPYLVSTAEQINQIGLHRCDWDKHFLLTSDIDLSDFGGDSFNIIGAPFTGIFDGNEHSIHNFTYVSTNLKNIGLFGAVEGTDAVVKNLGLIDANIDATSGQFTSIGIGSLIGELRDGKVSRCYADGGSIKGGEAIGGLVGANNAGKVQECWSSVDTIGSDRVGGLVGTNKGEISESFATGSASGDLRVGGLVGENCNLISRCYASGDIVGIYNKIGGLVGSNPQNLADGIDGYILDSFATGNAHGQNDVGGLAGFNSGTISSSYAIGEVSGHGLIYLIGGLVGGGTSNFITSSFWDIQVGGPDNGFGIGLLTEEMQDANTFTDVGWDFVGETANGTEDIWDICEGTHYPKQVWQIPIADFTCPDGVNMFDFAVLGSAWLSDPNDANWNQACDIFDPNDNIIDELDLGAFTENWLAGM